VVLGSADDLGYFRVRKPVPDAQHDDARCAAAVERRPFATREDGLGGDQRVCGRRLLSEAGEFSISMRARRS